MIWPKALIRVDPSVTTPVQQTQDEEEANDGDDDPNDFLAEIGRASCRERVYVLV